MPPRPIRTIDAALLYDVAGPLAKKAELRAQAGQVLWPLRP
jgi:hypothetical protein